MTVALEREILPQNVRPVHYVLQLEPVFKTSTTNGNVVIHLDVLEDSKEISVNMIDIELLSTHLTVAGEVVEPVRVT
jgi:aminopeptidase 2